MMVCMNVCREREAVFALTSNVLLVEMCCSRQFEGEPPGSSSFEASHSRASTNRAKWIKSGKEREKCVLPVRLGVGGGEAVRRLSRAAGRVHECINVLVLPCV